MTPITRRDLLGALLASGALAGCAAPRGEATTPSTSALRFDPDRFTRQTVSAGGRSLTVRAYEGLPVVERPVLPTHQALNLYVPEAYFEGGTVGRYRAATAPIFLPNGVGGYMPALPGRPGDRMGPPPAAGQTAAPSAMAVALTRGLVVAAPGARGRTQQAADGRWIGKAPAAIVDLKAAVRWLRHNAGRFPGDTERIVSNGTSAGGALSALLGASGNHPDYEPELQALGAAPGRDDVFAVSAYCPITHLEQADGAYEWQFHGIDRYRRIDVSMLDFRIERRETEHQLSAADLALSDALRAGFIAHVNGLGLRGPDGQALRLDADGRGHLREHIVALLKASAQRALDAGQDLSGRPWLTLQGARVQALDFDAYVRAAGRMKGLPAFDGLALESGENQLFGDATTDRRHFTDFAQQHGTVAGAQRADARSVRLMNALRLAAEPASRPARQWRIRQGTLDRDTSLAVPVLLAAQLRERGLGVDLALTWDRPHSGDYDLDELFAWIDRVVAAPAG